MRAPTSHRSFRALAVLAAVGLAAPLATTTHTVRRGETLSGIASSHNTSVAALVAANNISNPNLIVAGTTLRIGEGAAKAPTSQPTRLTYRVQRGDTLSSIASRHNVAVSQLVRWNKISNPNRIVAGSSLTVRPGSGGAAAASPAPKAPTATQHTVSRGETLSAIASRYRTTSVAIANANNLRNVHLIQIGQRLTIPAGGAQRAVAPTTADAPSKLLAQPTRLAYAPFFDRWAAEYNVPHRLLKAMNYLESGWQHTVVSHTGAVGVGQIMPGTADFINKSLLGGMNLDRRVPSDNIRMSARFLRYLLDLTNGDESMALAGYYQGLASVRRHGFFSSTTDYISGVLALRSRYTWNV